MEVPFGQMPEHMAAKLGAGNPSSGDETVHSSHGFGSGSQASNAPQLPFLQEPSLFPSPNASTILMNGEDIYHCQRLSGHRNSQQHFDTEQNMEVEGNDDRMVTVQDPCYGGMKCGSKRPFVEDEDISVKRQKYFGSEMEQTGHDEVREHPMKEQSNVEIEKSARRQTVYQHTDMLFALHCTSRALHRRVIPNGCLKAYALSLCAGKVLKCWRVCMSSDFTSMKPFPLQVVIWAFTCLQNVLCMCSHSEPQF